MSVVGFEFLFDGGGLGLLHQFDLKVDRKNPPPLGGFLFTMFPDQEPGGRGPFLKNHP